MLGEGSRPPSVHGDIQLRALPAGPRAIFPAVWACSDGGSPFHRIPGNVTASRIILFTGSVSFLGPCQGSRPAESLSPSARWRRDLPQLDQRPTVGRPPSPSNVLRLFGYFSLLLFARRTRRSTVCGRTRPHRLYAARERQTFLNPLIIGGSNKYQ